MRMVIRTSTSKRLLTLRRSMKDRECSPRVQPHVVGLLEQMKRGRGIKDLDDKSSGMEILMAEDFAKINPTDPLILGKQAE